MQPVVFSQIPLENTIAPFNHPGPLMDAPLDLYRLSWSQTGQSLQISVPDGDWSKRETLSLFIANDPTDPRNTGEPPLSLDIVLTDKSGQTASVRLDAQTASALRYLPSTVSNLFEGMDLPEYRQALRHTPLSTQLLALCDFAGIDLTQIDTVTLRGESAVGACMLGGLRVN